MALRNLLIVVTVGMSFFQQVRAEVWTVSTSGNDANSGIGASEAFATINHALNVAVCGDTVYVLAGNYVEKILAFKQCLPDQRMTVLGDSTGRPQITGDPLADSRVAISASGQGFVFEHLELTSPFPDECSQRNMVVVGQGRYMDFIDVIIHSGGYDGLKTLGDCQSQEFASHWRIVDSHIYDNGLPCADEGVLNGDGVDFTFCKDCEISNTTIENNHAFQVQIKLAAENVSVHDCLIKGTGYVFQIGKRGATPQCDSTAFNAFNVSITRNVIFNLGRNELVFLLQDVSNLEISNNTVIVAASDPEANGGFICFGGCGSNWGERHPTAPVHIRNNIFANRDASMFSNGEFAVFDPLQTLAREVSMNYNLFHDNNGDFVDPPDAGENSLVADPQWVAFPGDLRLQAGSPAIDAGDPSSPPDPDGSVSDIGAFYFDPITGVIMPEQIPDAFELFQNYPNPFNPETTIRYQLPRAGRVTLMIYNLLGEKVRTLVNTNQTAGRYAVVWDGNTGNGKLAPSGMYFYKLKIGGRVTATRKMLFLQ